MRRLLKIWLWFSVGATVVALLAKFSLKSRGEPSSEEIDLVSIFDGVHLVSAADPFYGGNILAVCGGTLLDLRKANPAPTGIHLDVAIFWGGVSIVVPPGWRVLNDADIIAGGYEDAHEPPSDDDAPVMRLTGRVLMGGLQVTTRSPVEAVA